MCHDTTISQSAIFSGIHDTNWSLGLGFLVHIRLPLHFGTLPENRVLIHRISGAVAVGDAPIDLIKISINVWIATFGFFPADILHYFLCLIDVDCEFVCSGVVYLGCAGDGGLKSTMLLLLRPCDPFL